VVTVLENSLSRSLLISPAWSPDGRYLLINSWQTEPQLAYRLLSYDTQTQTLVNLLGDQPSAAPGQPISVAAGFAPDGAALTFRLYSGQNEAFWMAFLDGSYVKELASAQIGANPPNGDFVAGFSSSWQRMALVVGGEGSSALWGTLTAAAIDGSGRQALDTQVPYRFQELGPVISPDGQRVVYFRLLPDTGQGELCIIRLDGSDRQVLFTARPEEMSQGKPVGIPWKWLPKP
jgi:Tol biopolymer transport system component